MAGAAAICTARCRTQSCGKQPLTRAVTASTTYGYILYHIRLQPLGRHLEQERGARQQRRRRGGEAAMVGEEWVGAKPHAQWCEGAAARGRPRRALCAGCIGARTCASGAATSTWATVQPRAAWGGATGQLVRARPGGRRAPDSGGRGGFERRCRCNRPDLKARVVACMHKALPQAWCRGCNLPLRKAAAYGHWRLPNAA